MKTFARHINLLLIAALVLAGVSPACEFISGRSLAEICKADGTVEKTAIPAELEIFLAAKLTRQRTIIPNTSISRIAPFALPRAI